MYIICIKNNDNKIIFVCTKLMCGVCGYVTEKCPRHHHPMETEEEIEEEENKKEKTLREKKILKRDVNTNYTK